jgi:transposase
VILAVKAIEGAGMVENGQVFVTMLRTVGDCIFWVTASGAGWTDKSPDTICRKRVVIKRQIPFVRTSAPDLASFYPSETAESNSTFMDTTLVKAE